MTQSRSRNRRTAALAGCVGVLALGGVATAFWSGAGSGTAQTLVDAPRAVALSVGGVANDLYPGGSSGVSIVASNANPYAVRVGSLSLDRSSGTGGFDVDAAHAGCDVAALAFARQDHGGSGWTVPPRAAGTDGTLPIDLTASLTMTRGAADACQGATFTVHLALGA